MVGRAKGRRAGREPVRWVRASINYGAGAARRRGALPAEAGCDLVASRSTAADGARLTLRLQSGRESIDLVAVEAGRSCRWVNADPALGGEVSPLCELLLEIWAYRGDVYLFVDRGSSWEAWSVMGVDGHLGAWLGRAAGSRAGCRAAEDEDLLLDRAGTRVCEIGVVPVACIHRYGRPQAGDAVSYFAKAKEAVARELL